MQTIEVKEPNTEKELFTSTWAYNENNKTVLDSNEYLKVFMEAMKLTGESRRDELVKISWLRPLRSTEPNTYKMNYINVTNVENGGQKEELVKTFTITSQAINQFAQLDTPALRIGWFKGAFNELYQQFIQSDGTPSRMSIDLRQQILYNICKKRTRMQKYFREEIPYVDYITVANGKPIFIVPENTSYKVKGIVGIHYPLKWSSYAMSQAIINKASEFFNDITYDLPYITKSGTIRLGMVIKDEKYTIHGSDEFEDDKLQLRIVFRDNAYGRESLSFYGGTERLVCSNGAYISVGSSYVSVPHQSLSSLVNMMVNEVLMPKKALNGSPMNDFEASLPQPLPVSEYVNDLETLYQHLSSVMISRLASGFEIIKGRYVDSVNLMVTDYKKAIRELANKFEMSLKMQDLLIKVANEDKTIHVNKDGSTSLYDLSNVFTSASNFMPSEENRKLLSTVGGNIIMNPAIVKKVKKAK